MLRFLKQLNQRGVIHLIPLLLLLAGIIAGVYLVQKSGFQIFRPKAASQNVEILPADGNDEKGNPCRVYEEGGKKKTNCDRVKLKILSPEDAGQASDAGPNISLIKTAYAAGSGTDYYCKKDVDETKIYHKECPSLGFFDYFNPQRVALQIACEATGNGKIEKEESCQDVSSDAMCADLPSGGAECKGTGQAPSGGQPQFANIRPQGDIYVNQAIGVNFNWQRLDGATRYRFIVDSKNLLEGTNINTCAQGYSNHFICTEKFSDGSYVVQPNIISLANRYRDGGTYTWWVDALDNNGDVIDTTNAFGVTIHKLTSQSNLDNRTVRWFCKDNKIWREFYKEPDKSIDTEEVQDGEDCDNGDRTCVDISNVGSKADAECRAKGAAPSPTPQPTPQGTPVATPRAPQATQPPAGALAPAAVVCQDNPAGATLPSQNYKWVADCNSTCQTNNDCPENRNDGFVCPSTSNWCFDFTGSVGKKCLRLEYIGSRTAGQIPAAPGGSCPERPAGAPGVGATTPQAPAKRVTKYFKVGESPSEAQGAALNTYTPGGGPAFTHHFKPPVGGSSYVKVIYVQFVDDKGEIKPVGSEKLPYAISEPIEYVKPSAETKEPAKEEKPAGGSTACSSFETDKICGGGFKTYDKCTDDKGQTGDKLCSGSATRFYCVGSGNSNCTSDPTGVGNYYCSACPNLKNRSSGGGGTTAPLGQANCYVRPARVNIGETVTYTVLVQGGKPPYYFNLTGDFSKRVTSQTDSAEITQTFDTAGLKRVNLIVGSGAEQSSTFCPAVQVSSFDRSTESVPSSNIPAGSACSAYETISVCGGGFKTYDKCTDNKGQTGSSLCSGGATTFYCVGSTNSNCDSSAGTGVGNYYCSGCPNLSNR